MRLSFSYFNKYILRYDFSKSVILVEDLVVHKIIFLTYSNCGQAKKSDKCELCIYYNENMFSKTP